MDIQRFHSALTLFDLAETHTVSPPSADKTPEEKQQRLLYGDWKQIAASDGAMTIYHFYFNLMSIKQVIERVKAFSQNSNTSLRVEAESLFRESFPGWQEVRDVSAHRAEFTRPKLKKFTQASLAKLPQGLVAGDPNVMVGISNALFGRKLVSAFKGEVFEYELSQASYKKLRRVFEMLFDSLVPLQEFTAQEVRHKFQNSHE